MESLDQLRQEIDGIDKELAALFLRRMDISRRVGEYKKSRGMAVLDAAREAAVLESKKALAPDEMTAREITLLFETIMGLSRTRQMQNMPLQTENCPEPAQGTVLFQGEAGAYTQEAALHYFGKESKLQAVAHWDDVFEGLKHDQGQYGVLPIENSTTGAITQVYDLLAEGGVVIAGEIVLPICHCLLGTPGGSISQIREVFSHPQGFYQCRRYLRQQPWKTTEMGNTALAAEYVARLCDPAKAAIASRHAAEVYGLSVLAHDIHDTGQNRTRFLVLQKETYALPPKDADKISLLFTLPHRSGSLYRVMECFARHGLNLYKLESRPIADRLWEYRFFADLGGNLGDDAVKQALGDLSKQAIELHVLGNYKEAAQ